MAAQVRAHQSAIPPLSASAPLSSRLLNSYSHNGGYVKLLQIGVQLLLYFCDFVDVLDGDLYSQEMTGHRGKLVLARGFFEKPAGLWGFDLEFECAVGEGGEFDLEGHVAADMGGDFIELLAEFHHINS